MRLPIWKKPTGLCTIPIGGFVSKKVSVNTASRDELIAINGIGEALADAIIEGRPWDTVNDLTNIKGIGENSIEALKEWLTV